MKPVILLRDSIAEESELAEAENHFPVYFQRSKVPSGSLVIGRYSVLPYYRELENDLLENGSCLINSYSQHLWIADLKEWYEDFLEITPKTWTKLSEIPEVGPFVLKGQTNSKKFNWKTHMFAKDKKEAIQVYSRLMDDSLISQQEIYIRQFVPLKKLADGLNDLQISEEYRFFILDGKVVSSGFYWSSHIDDLTTIPDPASVPQEFLDDVIRRIGTKARFVVVDIARTAEDTWIVVELNDGQMSGLSENKPETLYSNIKKILDFSFSGTNT